MNAPKQTQVLVLGDGLAGLAAAFAARQAGAIVRMVSRRAGGSVLMSGALDAPAAALDLVDDTLHSFIETVGLWSLTEARVATALGTTRTARAADRAILDLNRLVNARIAVPRLLREGWDADRLARSWSEDPWALSHNVSFVPIEAELAMSDEMRVGANSDLARKLDEPLLLKQWAEQLKVHAADLDAVLLGPWLGVETSAAALLSEQVAKPVGECLCWLEGAPGQRYERAVPQLCSALGIELIEARARTLQLVPNGVRLELDEKGEALTADAIVLACGTLLGGGVDFTPPEALQAGEFPAAVGEPFTLGVQAPLMLRVQSSVCEAPGSLQGMHLERLKWPERVEAYSALEQVWVGHEKLRALDPQGKALQAVLVAGALATGLPHCGLASISTGLSAGRLAAYGSSSR